MLTLYRRLTPAWVLALMFLAACGVCAAADDKLTDGLLNGRFWTWKGKTEGDRLLHESELLGYLLGACDLDGVKIGLLTSGPYIGQPSLEPQFCSKVLRMGEIVDGIAAFYSEPENMVVPVVRAMFFVKKQSEGASTSELETLKTGLRKAAAGKEAK